MQSRKPHASMRTRVWFLNRGSSLTRMWSVCDCIPILHFTITEEDTFYLSLARVLQLRRCLAPLLSEVKLRPSVSRHMDTGWEGRFRSRYFLYVRAHKTRTVWRCKRLFCRSVSNNLLVVAQVAPTYRSQLDLYLILYEWIERVKVKNANEPITVNKVDKETGARQIRRHDPDQWDCREMTSELDHSLRSSARAPHLPRLACFAQAPPVPL